MATYTGWVRNPHTNQIETYPESTDKAALLAALEAALTDYYGNTWTLGDNGFQYVKKSSPYSVPPVGAFSESLTDIEFAERQIANHERAIAELEAKLSNTRSSLIEYQIQLEELRQNTRTT